MKKQELTTGRVRHAKQRMRQDVLLSVAICALGTGPAGAEGEAQYSLSYSQISSGAGTATSASYSIEDTVRFPAPEAKSHRSVDYAIVNPQGSKIKANNGIAIVDGTEVRMVWPDARKPRPADAEREDAARLLGLAGIEGYHVHRSTSGAPGSFEIINPSLIVENKYTDSGLASGTYFYKVSFVNGAGTWIDWIGMFSAVVIGNEAPARDWHIYE